MKKLIILSILVLCMSISIFAFETEEKHIIDKSKTFVADLTFDLLKGNSEAEKTINAKIKSDMEYENIKKEAGDTEYGFFPHSFKTLDREITLNTNDFFSYYIHSNLYFGGAHGLNGYNIYNYKIKDGKAIPLTIDNIFRGKRKILNNIIAPVLAAQRYEKYKNFFNETEEEINTMDLTKFSDDVLDCFTMDGFGINFIFQEYSVGSYAEGEYIIFIPWSDLKKAVTDKDILEFINNTLARNNISGTISLRDMSSIPSNAKLFVKLIWIPVNKEPRALATKVYDIEKGTRKFSFKNTYDWRDKTDLNEYEVWFELYYDGVLAYREDQILPLTSQGWPQDTDISLEKVCKDTDIMRITSELVSNVPNFSYFEQIEIRLLDKNDKIVKKVFLKDIELPYIFDVAINAKDLTDTYHLNFFAIYSKDKNLKSTDYYPISQSNTKLPEKIVLK